MLSSDPHWNLIDSVSLGGAENSVLTANTGYVGSLDVSLKFVLRVNGQNTHFSLAQSFRA